MHKKWLPAIAGAIFVLGVISAPVINQSSILGFGTLSQVAERSSAGQQIQSVSNKITDQLNQPVDLTFVMPEAFAQVDNTTASQMAADGAHVKKVTLVAKEADVTLPQGDVIHAMTFNGTVPAPILRATQGDIIELTMINHPDNKNVHSIDMHASQISAAPNFGPIKPGESIKYTFVAENPGVFKYHCEGNLVLDMDMHVFSGMAGAFIVDPQHGYPRLPVVSYDQNGNQKHDIISGDAKEVVYQFSEWYLTKDGNYNGTAMFAHQPTYTTINGIPFGYDPVVTKTQGAMPLHFKQGDHVRFFLINYGDVMVNFHIVGEQLDRVMDGQKVAGVYKQTYLLGGSNDAIVDVVFDKPGVFAPVNHDYASLFKGQASFVVVDGPDGKPGSDLGLKDYKNPSNAIPPAGLNSIPVETTPYTLGEPLKWNGT